MNLDYIALESHGLAVFPEMLTRLYSQVRMEG